MDLLMVSMKYDGFFFAVKTLDFTRFRPGKNNYYIGMGYL